MFGKLPRGFLRQVNHHVRLYRTCNEAAPVGGMMELAGLSGFRGGSRPGDLGMEVDAGDPGMRRTFHAADGSIAIGCRLQPCLSREIQKPEHVA